MRLLFPLLVLFLLPHSNSQLSPSLSTASSNALPPGMDAISQVPGTPGFTYDPYFPSLHDLLLRSPSLTDLSLHPSERIQLCVDGLKTWTRYILPKPYHRSHQEEIRAFYMRCVRGVPYSEQYGSFDSFPAYLASSEAWLEAIIEDYAEQCRVRFDDDTGTINVASLEHRLTPTSVGGRGNFFMTTIVHLEHMAEQFE
jgi:hypothetical protein